MDNQKSPKETLESVQEELQTYKDLLLEALQSIKDRIPDIEQLANSKEEDKQE